MQFLPALAAAGISAEIFPFFDDAYLSRIYSGRTAPGLALAAYRRRIRDLSAIFAADLVWIEKEVLPWIPWPVERAFLPRDVPIVTDFDDAVFHRYDMHSSPLVRWSLGRKFDGIMEASALVTAGNSYLAARADQAGARSVAVVPTVVD
ncbi:MAG: glycosyltransferase family 1 protein, partial [Hyphomicrobiales bacterium]